MLAAVVATAVLMVGLAVLVVVAQDPAVQQHTDAEHQGRVMLEVVAALVAVAVKVLEVAAAPVELVILIVEEHRVQAV